MVVLVGAMVSFEEGHELLRELASVHVPTTHVKRAAEALGREIAHDERTVVEPPSANEPVAPTVYLGMDGTGVPIRKADLAGRAGQQPDGTPVGDAGSVTSSAAIESAAQADTEETPSASVRIPQGNQRNRRAPTSSAAFLNDPARPRACRSAPGRPWLGT